MLQGICENASLPDKVSKNEKIYLLPNFITTVNMLCGFYAIYLASRGQTEQAAWMIVLAGVFDMLDGRIARLAKATSSFGVEYDSLSDLVSFGVAPAILLVFGAMESLGRFGLALAFCYMTCGALRLARFNVSTGTAPKNAFQGLPIPAAAGMVASSFLFQAEFGIFSVSQWTMWGVLLAAGLAALMVSMVPFPSFKEVSWRSRSGRGMLLLILVSLLMLWTAPEATLFFIGVLFIVGSLVWSLIQLLKTKRTSVA